MTPGRRYENGLPMALSELRLIVRPGRGLVARTHGAVLFLADAEHPAAATLLDAFAGASGAEAVAALEAAAAGAASAPGFCLLVEVDAGIRLALHGGLSGAWRVGSEARTLAGAGGAPVEEMLPPGLGGFRCSDQPAVAGERLADLVEGIAPAGGFELAPRVAEVASVPPPVAAGDPGATQVGVLPPVPAAAREEIKQAMTKAFQAMGAAPAHLAPPEVEGRLCVGDHLNNPASRTCWICGDPVEARPGRGPRPPLGRVSTRDRRAFVLDGDFVLGRLPEAAEAVRAGRARPFVVPPEQTGVSRSHAAIELDGWEIRVRDLGSHNGTFVLAPGAADWQRVDPAQPVTIAPGTLVTLGGYEIVIEGL